MISVTHVVLMPPRDGRSPLIMVGTQVYASHYLDASLTVTAFVRDLRASRAYFVYMHRSSVDLLGGLWGGLARSIIESRARKDGPAILNRVAERLASGDPSEAPTMRGDPVRESPGEADVEARERTAPVTQRKRGGRP